jgi:hypothetical protein
MSGLIAWAMRGFRDEERRSASPAAGGGGAGAAGSSTRASAQSASPYSSPNGSFDARACADPALARQRILEGAAGASGAAGGGSGTGASGATTGTQLVSSTKLAQLDAALAPPIVDVAALRNVCWCGVPDPARRYEAWCVLLRYLPPQVNATAPAVLLRKRAEYATHVQHHHASVPWDALLATQSVQGATHSLLVATTPGSTPNFDASPEDVAIMRQIRKDVPRTFNGVLMLQHPRVQLLLERVLFVWALRHPASGYVQGMNDILLPFLYVVLAKRISSDGDVYRLIALDEAGVKSVSGSLIERDWLEVEADAYWLLSAFMSSVQGNFTFSQGGTHALVQRLEGIIAAADAPLHAFLRESGVSFEEFAFRWMNCFLLRELPPALGVRLFDTYCAEEADGGRGFGVFHVYVCAALLLRLSERLRRATDFAVIVQLLQNPASPAFDEEAVADLTARAFILLQQYGSH